VAEQYRIIIFDDEGIAHPGLTAYKSREDINKRVLEINQTFKAKRNRIVVVRGEKAVVCASMMISVEEVADAS